MVNLTLQFTEEQVCYCSNSMYDDLQKYYTTFRDISEVIKAGSFKGAKDVVTASISPENMLDLAAQ
jgi:hypothetical protein